MNKHSIPVSILLASLALAALAQDSPESVVRGSKHFSQRVVVSGLDNPWEVTWGPDGKLWVTERSGKRVTRVDPATGERRPAITIDEVSAPGGQDGLLGMALHPELLKGTGNDYVYVAYTYVDEARGRVRYVASETSPYLYLYGKIVRLTYNQDAQTLSNPVELIAGLPASNDHNAGRLKFGPDGKLYLTVGDHGNNQLGNYCRPVESQRLPTKQELKAKNYESYVGKSLRLNLDGTVPRDNPRIKDLRSHVYTYGHRNPQGLDFAADGVLYSTEHGPKTDDEVNVLKAGRNYGWPHVAGMQDNKAYEYARWAEASEPCEEIKFSDLAIHPSVPREPESAFKEPFLEPIATMFTVETGYDFQDPICKGIHYICWPTVGVSSVEHYQYPNGIPGWDRALLVATLKRGSLYVAPLDPSGQKITGPFTRYFQTENRYRDTAVSPDGRTIFIATDSSGLGEQIGGGATSNMQDPGAILAFTYERDGDAPIEPVKVTRAPASERPVGGEASASGEAPQFTAAQVTAGREAYNANCAVCHGNTLTNGTMGTPLAGAYFQDKWTGKTVQAFVQHARTMPPAAPDSLPAEVYSAVTAYVLDFNGFRPGERPLPTDPEALGGMAIR